MTITAGFLWRFLDDVWDLLPSKDRDLFEAYWSAQIQVVGNIQQKVLEARLSGSVTNVPVYETERWNRFQMTDESCDLFAATDTIQLTGLVVSALGRETALYHTLKVSTSTGSIFYTETMTFFDESVRSLRYGKLSGNFSVRIGGIEYVENRDYAVNRVDGTIQALTDGRLPIDTSATIYYFHDEYTRGLDYELDERAATIVRLAGSAITSGETVTVRYTYNNTATLALQSSTGAVLSDLTTLDDPNADFSALLPNRTLTIASGPNVGVYAISGVLSPTQLQISTAFAVEQEGEVSYSIDAFPHGVKVDKRIVAIPSLQERVDGPELVLTEGLHYIVRGGILALSAALPMSTLGPVDRRAPTMWAEKVSFNNETPYRNFGVLIDFYRENNEAYKLALQGLWYTFWTGSTPGNLERGLHILLGLPFAREAGTVVVVTPTTLAEDGEVQVQDERGRIVSYAIPVGLEVAAGIEVGATVTRFTSLSTGVRIIDRNNEPGFVAARLGRSGISQFLTSEASVGPGDTDETKALTLLENHLFLPQVLTEAVTNRINVKELRTFLDNMKPEWTTYVFSFNNEDGDEISFEEIYGESAEVDLSTTVNSNEYNEAWDQQDFIVSRSTGEIIGGGTQMSGNFLDPLADFAALGLGAGDFIRIASGTYQGYWKVLRRISATVLGIEIPDSPVPGAESGLSYVILQKEFDFGHDAVQLKREHVILVGENFTAGSVLSTGTDVDFLNLGNEEVKALLLVDPGNAGAEVQVITDARVDLGEITVATPPGAGAQDHEICSAALKRVDNTGPTVTHAFAI